MSIVIHIAIHSRFFISKGFQCGNNNDAIINITKLIDLYTRYARKREQNISNPKIRIK